MGLRSHMQVGGRAIAADTPETGLYSGSGLILNSGSTTEVAPLGNALASLLDTAVEEACTGRAAGCTGNPTRPASVLLGGAA